jgi:transcriptional regulator with XRE-family HTH domain
MDNQHRQVLSAFLRDRRDRMTPEMVGLPKGGRRRTPGLRREEVAQLAGVGATWYTWLEQGRDIRVSAQVLESIARVLRLSEAERAYLFELARQEEPTVQTQVTTTISSTLQWVLDQQRECPAYILGWRWDVLAWNEMACKLLIDFSALQPCDRNILRLLFTDTELRRKQANWEQVRQETLAHFRSSCAPYLRNAAFTELIEQLITVSPEFRIHWQQLKVATKRSSLKTLNHPFFGQLTFEMLLFQITDILGATMVLLVPDAVTRDTLTHFQ